MTSRRMLIKTAAALGLAGNKAVAKIASSALPGVAISTRDVQYGMQESGVSLNVDNSVYSVTHPITGFLNKELHNRYRRQTLERNCTMLNQARCCSPNIQALISVSDVYRVHLQMEKERREIEENETLQQKLQNLLKSLGVS